MNRSTTRTVMAVAGFVAVVGLASPGWARAVEETAAPGQATGAAQATGKPATTNTPQKPAGSGTSTQKPQTPPAAKPNIAPAPVVAAPSVPTPPDYVIGPEDILQVLYWQEKEWSAEVMVRPDGLISLPQLNDVQASGLKPEQLRERIVEAARKFFKEDPDITVVVKQINSRKVFITGQVGKPGPYPLTAPTTVLQLIAMSGGLSEFAKKKDIVVMRAQNGKQLSFRFNYEEVMKRKNLKQNIELLPGDTVIVP